MNDTEIIAREAEEEASAAQDSRALYEVKMKFLGRAGKVTALLKSMKDVAAEERPAFGKKINALREKLEERFAALESVVKKRELESRLSEERLDVTMPGRHRKQGALHPVTRVKNQLVDLFAGMGFEVYEGPEIETEYYDFTALNTPADHPARDMQDTFFIQRSPDVLLRTHTSSVQSRVMEHTKPPIRILCPGRVYRNEAISARAHCFFHQVEGLYIDKGVSFADLKQTLLYFAREMFGAETKIRLRPSYFPFTEPSAEMDISCNLCGGKGCSFCKGTGWVEILGCGMVDPNVLDACGIDSKEYNGYALGMGVERIANLKYRVNDLRLFSENDVRFLREFTHAH